MIFIISTALIAIWTLVITIILLKLAFKYPLMILVLYITISILPFLFEMTPIYDEAKWALIIGFGIRTSDYLLIIMLIAVLIKIIFHIIKKERIKNLSLFLLVMLFSIYLLFEILRNIIKYEISAFGEFRYTYISLILPIYIVYFFSSEVEITRLFKFSIFTSLIVTLLCIPIIGFLKSWDIQLLFDPINGRFLPSGLSLGLFYGLLGLIFGKKYGVFKLSSYKIFLIGVFSGIIIFTDGHRSVWLSIAIIFILLLIFKIQILRISFRLMIPVLIVIFFLLLINNYYWNIYSFISERMLAFTNPIQDPDANWRLINWSFQLGRFFHSPIIGEGFGGYWGFSLYKNDIFVMPHNLYIMILAKLGLIGLILYLGTNIKIFLKLKKALSNLEFENGKQTAIIILAFISLIGANIYAIAYPIDPLYSWIFIGLGLAIVLNKKENDS